MAKKRILLINEFSLMNTGFSVMAYDLFTRLHATGKYELAELASYVSDDDPRINQLPWRVYPVIPSDSNDEEKKLFQKEYATSQFGSLRFNQTVLDFMPDIVFSYRDYWHDEFILRSESRRCYKYIWSVCVDSEPPRDEWLSTFSTVDLLTSYTEWGLSVLNKYGNNKLNVATTNTMPGIDIEIFKPMDKSAVRKDFGISEDSIIITTVMRNQPRKLFPNLIKSFSRVIDRLLKDGKEELTSKVYLHLHTGNPDCGFDIPKEIIRYGVPHKVIVTYYCGNCQSTEIAMYRGDRCYCSGCGKKTNAMANTSSGPDRPTLAKIYNLGNLYVQHSTAGALEIPIIEAKACGLPVVSMEYAAPYELARLGGSYGQVSIAGWKQEGIRETSQIRAIPNDKDLEDLIYSYVNESKETRDRLSTEARETAVAHHGADGFCSKWMEIFDSIEQQDPFRWFDIPAYINSSKIKNAVDICTKTPTNKNPIDMASSVISDNSSFFSAYNVNNIKDAYYGNSFNSSIEIDSALSSLETKANHHNQFEAQRFNTHCPTEVTINIGEVL